MSTVSEEGVMTVKTEACDRLLAQRVEVKLKSKNVNDVVNRLHVAIPKPRDDKERPPFIPEAAKKRAKAMEVDQFKKLQKHFEQELMEDYRFDDRALYLVKDDEKYDIVPEILNGKNIADYIDQDIFEKLENLEEKEGLREAAGFYDSEGEELDSEDEEIRKTADKIRQQKKIRLQEHRDKKSRGTNAAILPRKASIKVETFGRPQKRKAETMDFSSDEDVDMESAECPARSRSAIKKLKKKRKAEASQASSDARAHSSMGTPRDKGGIVDPERQAKVKKIAKLGQRKLNQFGRAGESDRHIHVKKPKHLFSGKRKQGKTQRR